MSLEHYLVEHCSPTLASLKTANLFRLPYTGAGELIASLAELQQQLEPKGVSFEILRQEESHALLYVYRRSRLNQDLHKAGVDSFLETCGYTDLTPENALAHLKERIAAESGFPHEIGLFLGYPLGDVIGFIENQGRNSKCCGCWKVYCDECEAKKLFARFDKCRDIYKRLFLEGRSLWQLTVAA